MIALSANCDKRIQPIASIETVGYRKLIIAESGSGKANTQIT